MKNIFMVDLSHNYYVDIAKKLTESDLRIKVIGASRLLEYWPSSLNEYISLVNPRIVLWEDLCMPESFARVFDPDYSVLSLGAFSELAYYEKLFLLSTDRLSFFPISQIDRCRLFYRYISHFYNILKKEQIDSVIFFGTPHGPWSIALFGLAKIINLDAIYVDWVGLSPDLSTIETQLHIRRSYSPDEMDLGLVANSDESKRISDIVTKSIDAELVWTVTKHINRPMAALRTIGSLLLKRPLEEYTSPELFLNPGRRKRICYAFPLIKYFINTGQVQRFYEKNTSDDLPDNKSLVLFLHLQPEASSMPMGGIFADQLLVLDLILTALPEGMNVYVKEHPFMFEALAQDRHERTVEFYAHMLKDPRVRFVKRSVNSKLLMKNAKFVASTVGSISWESMRAGKPCVIFGWAWFSSCESCFSVDSVESLKSAFKVASIKSRDNVLADVRDFLDKLKNRLIYAAGCRPALNYLSEDYSYDKSVVNLSSAIGLSIGISSAPAPSEDQ